MEAPNPASKKTIAEVASIFNIPPAQVEHGLDASLARGLTRDERVEAAWKDLECQVPSESLGERVAPVKNAQEAAAASTHGSATCAVPGSDCHCDAQCRCPIELHEDLFFNYMTQTGRRIAFCSKVWVNGRLAIPLRKARWYCQNIDKAVEIRGKQAAPGMREAF